MESEEAVNLLCEGRDFILEEFVRAVVIKHDRIPCSDEVIRRERSPEAFYLRL